MIHSIKLECMLQMILETYITSPLLEVTYQIRECIVVQCGSIYDYSANNASAQVKVRGWKQVATKTVSGVTYTCNYNGEGVVKVNAEGSNVSCASGNTHDAINWIPSSYAPKTSHIALLERSVSNNIIFYMWGGSGSCGITNTYSSSKTVNISFEVVYGISIV